MASDLVADVLHRRLTSVPVSGAPPAPWYRDMVDLGETDTASRMAARWPRAAAKAYAALAVALHAAGDVTRSVCAVESALCAIDPRDPTWDRVDGLTAVATAITRSMGLRAAQFFATSIADPQARAAALASAAQAVIDTGRRDELTRTVHTAHDAAQRPGDPSRRAEALVLVSQALAPLDPDEARDVAMRIEEPWSRAEALLAIGQRETLPHALAAAEEVGYPAWRAEALAATAITHAAFGEQERALVLAHGIGDVTWRAEALMGIAAAAPDHEEVSRLVDEAFRLGEVTTHLWWSRARTSPACSRVLQAEDRLPELPPSMAPRVRAHLLIGVIGHLANAATTTGVVEVLDLVPPAPVPAWEITSLRASCARLR